MRREVLVAIVVGILLGAVVAFGIWRTNSYLVSKQSPNTSTEQTTPQEEQKQAISTSQLVLTQPEDNSVSSQNFITVKGSATPKSTILVLGNSSEAITEAAADGSFEQDISLDGGANEITVLAYDDQGNESIQTTTVVYSTEFGGEEKK